MILIAYKRVDMARAELDIALRRAFSSDENCGYIDGIVAKKNDLSASESLTALLLLSNMAAKLGYDIGNLILRRGDNGKPYFEESLLDFSISHSRGIVAVALSDSGTVGIDLEASEISDEKARKLAERYFGGAELSAGDFLKQWVKREAYVKLCGSTLSECIGKEVPDNVGFFDFDIFGHPASVAYLGEQAVEFYTESIEL